MRVRTDKPRGLLNPLVGAQHFHLIRYLPSDDLSEFIEHYWIVSWDLRGRAPYTSENLPYPSVNLVFEPGQSGLFGVVSGKFAQRLEGRGLVFAVKFRPGGFHPLVNVPVARFTDRVSPVEDVFGAEGAALEAAILADEDTARRIALAEAFLRPRLPAHDETVALVNHIVDVIAAHPDLTRVADVAAHCHLSPRTVQRLFQTYVGISPKWVIQRYRLHAATERLETDAAAEGPGLALNLGYFDQAHFIKDFKTVTGRTPAAYVRQR